MTTHRTLSTFDSGEEHPGLPETQPTLNERLTQMEEGMLATVQILKDHDTHLDNLFNRYYDLWDAVEKLSEGIAQTVPLPLKYK